MVGCFLRNADMTAHAATYLLPASSASWKELERPGFTYRKGVGNGKTVITNCR